MIEIVISLYFPDNNSLRRINSLTESLSLLDNYHINLIDNTNNNISIKANLDLLISSNILTIWSNGENRGLSIPFNEVIKNKIDKAKYFLFFDQDSMISVDLINKLIKSYVTNHTKLKIGVISGCATMLDGTPHIILNSSLDSDKSKLREVYFTPTSFSLIPVDVFNDVGFFHPDFFIDHIDVEFCKRAKKKGWVTYIDDSISFHHIIGDEFVDLGIVRFPISKPFRHFYQIRNIIFTRRIGTNTSTLFMSYELLRKFLIIIIIGIKKLDIHVRLKYAFKGLIEGFLKKLN